MGRMTSLAPCVPPAKSVDVSTGTTILAISYEGGTVLACDTRVSLGQYVCSRTAQKIARLCDNVYLARSGSAADTQIVSDFVSHYAEQQAITLGANPDVWSVANLAAQINYKNKQLMSYMVVGGWDPVNGGEVYSIVQGGTIVKEKWAIDGSGSTYIWGACDALYKDGMTREEAESMAITLVGLAIATDSGSGGMCRLVTVDKDGVHKKLILPKDFPPIPYELIPAAVDEEGSGGMIVD